MTKFLDMTARELLVIAHTFAKSVLHDKEYNSVEMVRISLTSEGMFGISLSFTDDFQDGLEGAHRFKYSFFGETFFFKSEEEIAEELAKWPGRSKREFTVLRKQLAGVGAFSDKLTSLAGRAFADELRAVCKSHNLLEAQE